MELLQLLELLLLQPLLQVVVTDGVLALVPRLHVLLQHGVRLVQVAVRLVPLVQIHLGVGVRQGLPVGLQVVQIQVGGLAEGQLDGAHPALAGSGTQPGRRLVEIEVLVHLGVEDAGRSSPAAGSQAPHGSTADAQGVREASDGVLGAKTIRFLRGARGVPGGCPSARSDSRTAPGCSATSQQETAVAVVVELTLLLVLLLPGSSCNARVSFLGVAGARSPFLGAAPPEALLEAALGWRGQGQALAGRAAAGGGVASVATQTNVVQALGLRLGGGYGGHVNGRGCRRRRGTGTLRDVVDDQAVHAARGAARTSARHSHAQLAGIQDVQWLVGQDRRRRDEIDGGYALVQAALPSAEDVGRSQQRGGGRARGLS